MSETCEILLLIHCALAVRMPSYHNYPAASPLDSWGKKEIERLKMLTDAACSCTPKLLEWGLSQQQGDLVWLPGGYFIYLVMEKLPGQDLRDFWDYPLEKRIQIRAAFHLAYR